MEKRYEVRLSLSAIIALFILLMLFSHTAYADDYPEYIIQEGDFLSIVAQDYFTTVDEILSINNISDVNNIAVGSRIKIPSLAGLHGTIATNTMNIGDTIQSVSILSQLEMQQLAEINRIVSPTEVYVGSVLTTLSNDGDNSLTAAGLYESGATNIEKAARNQVNPALLADINTDGKTWNVTENQLFFLPVSLTQTNSIHKIAPFIDVLEIKQLPLVQGETHVVHLKTSSGITLSGSLNGQDLHFYQDAADPTDWFALVGIDAMEEIGLTNFSINGNTSDGQSFSTEQQVLISAGIFTNEVVEGVDSSTLDSANVELDAQTIKSINGTSSVRTWGDAMSYPVDSPCFASGFGNRRSYNDGTFYNYHTGADFSVCAADNINIYAAADGTVLFASMTPIHGNFTIIDHGWGVYTSYSHQSSVNVTVGQAVKRGDLIGLIGSTGRSVGPHLHWEVIINSVYVNPMTWLNPLFP